MKSLAPCALLLGALLLLADRAYAQSLLLGGGIAAGTGVERSALLGGQALRRARTRIALSVDARNDEDPKQGLGGVLFAELEPHGSLGASLRYLRFFGGGRIVPFVGATGIVAPHTLAGVELGADIRLPLDRPDSTRLFIEPSLAVLPLGTDLPGDSVLIWGLLSVGVHANL